MSVKFSATRRGVICGGASAGLLSLALPALGQTAWPEREVKVIVPFAAGGGTDLVSRLFAQKLSDRVGKPFFVENMAGGTGGSIGSRELARSTPNGYTIGSGTSSGIVAAAIDPGPYNPLRDLEPISRYGATTIVLVVSPSMPVRTFAEFVAYAKTKPGLTYASSGIGSANHLTGVMLAKQAGLELTHVPYKGEGAAITDVLSGTVDMIFVSLPLGRVHMQSAALRPLAITSAQRFPMFPDLPTFVELGFADLIVEAWYGLYVPKGTPDVIRDKLVAEISAIRRDEAVLKQLIEQFTFDARGQDDPKKFRAYMEAELARFRAAALAAGLAKS
ncbi:Bug family tripartite tricarboxylate transporter substrate binding protein [Chelatococcus asaccharovorans]|uniref:Bug family tripartite tricarboxylate transporter substrate binding protein n=1 Tax=Chelatococcus asaccharovorans TaxID=28210 RepID=UPI00224C76CA|nr:tripartite tricarboxylate transporter substrate binding protein [Chelatococcus asaccharovorans]CAH1655811.1 Tripartite-type tricarboxylate transporter receptor subunit TctC [Chelatococcus asaccharovorans]CAH1685301.1 Tripartite-type tricarboxylate transporter receptor subunit TctC [Chelatococcus asaccharovorans]